MGAVLATFGDARLLVFDRDLISRSPTAEVAHEALLTGWPRLVGWIDEAGEDLLLHGRLRDGLGEWEDRDREAAYLLTGGRLAQFDAWRAPPTSRWPPPRSTSSRTAARRLTGNEVAAAGGGT